MKVIAKVNTQIEDEKGELQMYEKGEEYNVTEKFFDKWKNHFKAAPKDPEKPTKETTKK